MKAADSSLLDLMIARLTTQRRFLERACQMVERVDGPVLEVGLGKGRTYSHLRKLMPSRAIIAFDRELHAPPKARPATQDLALGEFDSSLRSIADRLGRTAALAHADFGSPDIDQDVRQAAWLGPLLQPLVRPGGVVVSDRRLVVEGWRPMDEGTTHPWAYFSGWWSGKVRSREPPIALSRIYQSVQGDPDANKNRERLHGLYW